MNTTAPKKKILLISPDYMDYTDMMRTGIEEYLGAEVWLLTTTGIDLKFTYRNPLSRIKNFFSKILLNRNAKKLFYKNVIEQKLEDLFANDSQFDDILILRPDLIKEHLDDIKNHGNRMIAYFWDSFSRIPDGKNTLKYFDKFFSFEPKDVKDHNLLFLTNFYPADLGLHKTDQTNFDLSYVASFDSRVTILENILSSLWSLDLKTNINIITTPAIATKTQGDKSILWFTDVLPRAETIRIMKESKVLLDIAQPKQEGLSFRVFEALALEKKIITTNRAIASYDFYTPDNIFIWQDGCVPPSRDFFNAAYTSPPPSITGKYTLQSWVNKIFEI